MHIILSYRRSDIFVLLWFALTFKFILLWYLLLSLLWYSILYRSDIIIPPWYYISFCSDDISYSTLILYIMNYFALLLYIIYLLLWWVTTAIHSIRFGCNSLSILSSSSSNICVISSDICDCELTIHSYPYMLWVL